MKNYIKDIKLKAVNGIIILFAVLLVFPACNDRMDEMNQNPGKVLDVPDDFLFATAVRNTFRVKHDRIERDYGGQYAHHGVSNSWATSTDKYFDYILQGDIPEEIFRDIYKDCIKYTNDIIVITSAEETKNDVRNAMTQIVAVINFTKLTDFFGDVPYFEAAMGKQDIFLPAYDKQEDIYSDMVARLKASIQVLASADAINAYPDQDPMYDNDLEKWVRFANSFRLRLAMRARFADAAKYEPIIAECLTLPLIETNDQNATLEHEDTNTEGLYNPWYEYQRDYNNGLYNYNLSEMFIEILKTTADPRLPILAAPNSSGEYTGMPNGLNDEAFGVFIRSEASTPSELVLARDQPLYLMTAAEIWFLRAEAAVAGIGSAGDAATLYQTGIQSTMDLWGLAQGDIDTYFATTEGALNGDDDNQLRQIGTQMWIAFFPNSSEAWTNIRRTGYPEIAQRADPSQGVTNGYLPKRLLYPYTVEKTLNGTNQQVAIDRMGDDKIDNPVWWDVID